MNPDVTHVHVRGTWQLCHVRRLAFPLNISFYLIWRSKFRILRIKKTRTKMGTLRISHTSSRLDLRKIGAITDKVWWLSRAYKCSLRRGFFLYQAGTRVGPDQLGPPVRVGSTRIDSDQLRSNKKNKNKIKLDLDQLGSTKNKLTRRYGAYTSASWLWN